MHDLQVVESFDQRSLLTTLRSCGLTSSPVRVFGFDGVSRSIASTSGALAYSIALDAETLKFLAFIDNIMVPVEFIVDWNNHESVAPLIRLERDPPEPGAMHKLILKFDVNVRRGLPLATFRQTMVAFEAALRRLHVTALAETAKG